MKNSGKQQRPWINRMLVGAILFVVLATASCSQQSTDSSTSSTLSEREGATTTQATGKPATPALTAGPFFKEHSPERASLLEPGIEGTKLVVTGHVLTRGGRPVAKVRLDFWHANDDGFYDNVDFKLRGHQFTDEDGNYRLETIVPGIYDPRTRHIHVKVLPPEGPGLTTQLFFPNEPRNQTDSIFRPELVMDVRDSEDGKQATFDFVLDIE